MYELAKLFGAAFAKEFYASVRFRAAIGCTSDISGETARRHDCALMDAKKRGQRHDQFFSSCW
jgi:hypothetical protein